MSDLKKEYDKIIEQRKNIIDQIKQIEETDIVKQYNSLKEQNTELVEKISNLSKKIKIDEYNCCKHILVYSKIDHDRIEGRTYKSHGCIKCGLDNSILDSRREFLPLTKQIMYDYLKNRYLKGKELNVACDLDLAQAIYSKIKETHPDIDDETAIKYFEIALDHIRNIKVSDERKIGRSKRLALNTDFRNWMASDVHCG